eukprot:4979919-Pyramimonas_sp.AAC.1
MRAAIAIACARGVLLSIITSEFGARAGQCGHPQDTRLVVDNEDDREQSERVVVVPRNELRLNKSLLGALLVASRCNAGADVSRAGSSVCLARVKLYLHVRL